jgi:hypothetical protein
MVLYVCISSSISASMLLKSGLSVAIGLQHACIIFRISLGHPGMMTKKRGGGIGERERGEKQTSHQSPSSCVHYEQQETKTLLTCHDTGDLRPCPRDYSVPYFIGRVTVEGNFSCKYFRKQYTVCIHVYSSIERFVLEELWCHIHWGTGGCVPG